MILMRVPINKLTVATATAASTELIPCYNIGCLADYSFHLLLHYLQTRQLDVSIYS